MSYKYVSEDDFGYQILHPGGHTFSVAKKGLSKKTIDQIESMKEPLQKMPVMLAEGGFVPEEEDPLVQSLQFDPFAQVPTSIDLAAEKARLNTPASEIAAARSPSVPLEQAQAVPFAFPTTPRESVGLPVLPQDASRTLANQGAGPTESDLAADMQASAIAGLDPAMLEEPQIQAPSGPSLQGQYQQAMSDQQKGLMAQAQAQEQAGLEQAKAYQAQAQEIASLQANYQKNFSALQKDMDVFQKDVMEQKIDPNRVWSSMSTGNKALTAVSLILGAIGAGAGGTQNIALKVLDDTISRDIEAQKADLGKKQNLLSMNMQRMNDLRQAESMTRLQILATTEAKVKQAQANAMGPQAKANAQMMLGQIRAQALPIMASLAQKQATNASPLAQKIQALPEAVQKDAWKEVGDLRAIESSMGQIKKIMTDAFKATSVGENLKAPIQSAQAREMVKGQLFPIVKSIVGEKMTDADVRAMVDPLLPGFGTNEATLNKNISSLMNQLRSRIPERTATLTEFGLVPKQTQINFKKGL